MNKPLKDPVQMMDDADGNPQWLREALSEIFQRLPPIPPPAPPAAPSLPSWDPKVLAILSLDPAEFPLAHSSRWHLASWLKNIAADLIDGTEEWGDSKEGFHTIHTLSHARPSSGPRERRGE